MGQHQIEDQDVRTLPLDEIQRLETIMCLKNTKPFPFEMIGDERGDVLLIVHHEDLHAFASS